MNVEDEELAVVLKMVTTNICESRHVCPPQRCDCRVLPDEEEIDLYLPEGSAAVMAVVRKKETLGSDVLATVSDGFFGVASRLTATAAAESAALAWSSYEV